VVDRFDIALIIIHTSLSASGLDLSQESRCGSKKIPRRSYFHLGFVAGHSLPELQDEVHAHADAEDDEDHPDDQQQFHQREATLLDASEHSLLLGVLADTRLFALGLEHLRRAMTGGHHRQAVVADVVRALADDRGMGSRLDLGTVVQRVTRVVQVIAETLSGLLAFEVETVHLEKTLHCCVAPR